MTIAITTKSTTPCSRLSLLYTCIKQKGEEMKEKKPPCWREQDGISGLGNVKKERRRRKRRLI
jgi:hypothetical protein